MAELIPLTDGNLGKLPSHIRTPRYDRSKLTPGIVHIGLGNFHRAHQAWYLHRLFDRGTCHDWAIIGAGIRAADEVRRIQLQQQDFLTTLIELDPSGMSAEVCGSMIGFLPVEDGNKSLIARMAEPDIRIVSMTVTEGGYYIDPASGEFDDGHRDIIHDAQNPDRPKTVFGAMIAALRLRRDCGHGPFTGLCCDNLQGNGVILRDTVVQLAKLSDPELATWIDDNCSFPNSMVDCIVPATGESERELVKTFGIADSCPVTHENFRQWVIEDNFCAGRPDWDRVDATFVSDVHDYEVMKLRILNGGHQIVSIPGELLGIKTISEAMANESIRRFFKTVVGNEVAPHVRPVPGTDPLSYLDLIEARFSNPEIKDTTRRVAFDGSSRQPGFLIPSIRDGLHAGSSVEGLALANAMWCKYCEGFRENGEPVEPNDPNWSELVSVARAAVDNPRIWLGQDQYYGSIGSDSRYVEAFVGWHNILSLEGVIGSINMYLNKQSEARQRSAERR